MPTSTDVDRHRIACQAFESKGGRDRSRFANSARKLLADFDDHDEALLHCLGMFDRWSADGVTSPSSLTAVLAAAEAFSQPIQPEPIEVAPESEPESDGDAPQASTESPEPQAESPTLEPAAEASAEAAQAASEPASVAGGN